MGYRRNLPALAALILGLLVLAYALYLVAMPGITGQVRQQMGR